MFEQAIIKSIFPLFPFQRPGKLNSGRVSDKPAVHLANRCWGRDSNPGLRVPDSAASPPSGRRRSRPHAGALTAASCRPALISGMSSAPLTHPQALMSCAWSLLLRMQVNLLSGGAPTQLAETRLGRNAGLTAWCLELPEELVGTEHLRPGDHLQIFRAHRPCGAPAQLPVAAPTSSSPPPGMPAARNQGMEKMDSLVPLSPPPVTDPVPWKMHSQLCGTQYWKGKGIVAS